MGWKAYALWKESSQKWSRITLNLPCDLPTTDRLSAAIGVSLTESADRKPENEQRETDNSHFVTSPKQFGFA